MKKLLLTTLTIFLSAYFLLAQQNSSKVILKSGIEYIGEIKELNPESHLVIRIGSFDIRLSMNDIATVQSVATLEDASKPVNEDIRTEDADDCSDMPETITINVDGEELTMILVKGGQFRMGYDGNGSLKMDSEPVHPVRVSSFYINNSLVSSALAKKIFKSKSPSFFNEFYYVTAWNNAFDFTEALNKKTGLQFRLPTEAEWEYLATSRFKDKINYRTGENNFCLDWKEEYPAGNTVQINPTGPANGRYHVVRQWVNEGPEIYHRYSENSMQFYSYSRIFVRVVLPVEAARSHKELIK